MISKVNSYLENNEIRDSKVIVAVSGGSDSISLLYALNILKKDYNILLEAAYVNHGIRSELENKMDLQIIEELTQSINIKLHVKNIDYGLIEEIASKSRSSVESVARDIRYDFFNSLTGENDYIAIGHNRDDQFETQIMRFFQGSSLSGLTGIKDRRSNIIRPLINIDKISIINYLNSNKVKYREDVTNNSLDYLRNRVRKQLVPIVKDIFPSYEKSLKKLELDFKEYHNTLNYLLPTLQWQKEDKTYFVDYNKFITYPFFRRREILFEIFDITFKGDIKDFRLPSRFFTPLKKGSFKNGEIILDGYGFYFKRVGSHLIWGEKADEDYFFKLKVSSPCECINSRYKITCSEVGAGNVVGKLSFPFIIRSPITGFPEMKILKKSGIKKDLYRNIIIIEKENEVYAIINRNMLMFNRYDELDGLFIDIAEVKKWKVK